MKDSIAAQAWLDLRTALRLLLEAVAGCDLRQRPFGVDLAGKPFLPDDIAPISFSLSHSGHHALIAICRDVIGADVEQARRTDFERDRALIISAGQALAGENAFYAGASSANDDDLLRAWVRLEAVAKARGSGIGALFNDIGLRGPDKANTPEDLAARAAALMIEESLRLEDLPLPLGLWGAVSVSVAVPRIELRDFPAAVDGFFDFSRRSLGDGRLTFCSQRGTSLSDGA
jgi:4'-phosphopantetheinyl transferase